VRVRLIDEKKRIEVESGQEGLEERMGEEGP
jgi:hypothetical protein